MSPRILYYDIETAPNLARVWGHYEQNVIEYQSEWYILCFAYQWEGEKDINVVSLPDFAKRYKKDPEDDYDVVKKLWQLFDEADVIIAHNGDKFDNRKAAARFAYHRLGPPSPPMTIDTLKIAKRYFAFNSNKLNDLGQHLGLGKKVSTGGYETWAGCIRGEKKYWDLMIKYNRQDIKLLRDVYMVLRPWLRNHPGMGQLMDDPYACPTCGSSKLQKRGVHRTKVSTFQRYQCNTCGAYSRDRLSDKNVVKPEIVPT